jgi:hypothetical protein
VNGWVAYDSELRQFTHKFQLIVYASFGFGGTANSDSLITVGACSTEASTGYSGEQSQAGRYPISL